MIYNRDGTRTLKEVMLHECSLVAVPANPRAQVTSVKSLAQIEHLLHGIKPGDVTGDTLDQLKRLSLSVNTPLKKDDHCSCSRDDCVAGNCADCTDDCAECENCEGCIAARQEEVAEVIDARKLFRWT